MPAARPLGVAMPCGFTCYEKKSQRKFLRFLQAFNLRVVRVQLKWWSLGRTGTTWAFALMGWCSRARSECTSVFWQKYFVGVEDFFRCCYQYCTCRKALIALWLILFRLADWVVITLLPSASLYVSSYCLKNCSLVSFSQHLSSFHSF